MVRGSWGAEPARCPSRGRPHRPGPLEKGIEEEGNCRANPGRRAKVVLKALLSGWRPQTLRPPVASRPRKKGN